MINLFYTCIAGKPLTRTISGSSQISDVEEHTEVNHRRDGLLDMDDDYPIPGYLPADKSQELESSHQNSDVTHSSGTEIKYTFLISYWLVIYCFST